LLHGAQIGAVFASFWVVLLVVQLTYLIEGGLRAAAQVQRDENLFQLAHRQIFPSRRSLGI